MYDFDATNVLSNEKHTDYDYFDKAKGYWKRKEKKQLVDVPAEVGESSMVHRLANEKDVKEENEFGSRSLQVSLKADGLGKTTNTPKMTSKTYHKGTHGNKNKKKSSISKSKTHKDKSRTMLEDTEKILYKSTNRIFPVSSVNYNTIQQNTTEVFETNDNSDLKVVRNALTYVGSTEHRVEGVNETKVTEAGGPPYIALLAGSTAVLAISFIVLLALYIYRRRKYGTSVITDEMYNAYKLNKKIESRSPLPSPRSSEQEVSCGYDFIHAGDNGKIQTDEIRQAGDSVHINEFVYLELNDMPRYDYAEIPGPILPAEDVPLTQARIQAESAID